MTSIFFHYIARFTARRMSLIHGTSFVVNIINWRCECVCLWWYDNDDSIADAETLLLMKHNFEKNKKEKLL